MLRKILQKIGTKLFPYWCSYCPRRYRTEQKFHDHFLLCEGRKSFYENVDQELSVIAPVNRKAKRAMAKKAGQIKDWSELNAP